MFAIKLSECARVAPNTEDVEWEDLAQLYSWVCDASEEILEMDLTITQFSWDTVTSADLFELLVDAARKEGELDWISRFVYLFEHAADDEERWLGLAFYFEDYQGEVYPWRQTFRDTSVTDIAPTSPTSILSGLLGEKSQWTIHTGTWRLNS